MFLTAEQPLLSAHAYTHSIIIKNVQEQIKFLLKASNHISITVKPDRRKVHGWTLC